MRFLALGDSYTMGEGVADADRWPNQLARALRAHDIDIDDPLILARTAWTTDELSDAIDASGLRDRFDLVTLMVGVNDQYRSRPVRAFAGEFELLLRRAKGFAGRRPRRVIALSIPDWGATPFARQRNREAIAREIDAYNARAHELAALAGVRWVDVTTASRGMQDDPTLATSDGLHPSAEMYRRWMELVLPAARGALARRARARG